MSNQGQVESFGRVRYIEPTNFFLNKEGTLSDGINFPYEDYNMAVDLSIIQTNRFCCGWWTLTGDRTKITYSSKSGGISFLGGSKIGGDGETGYLTTNFTNINPNDPDSDFTECLGIESINISYNSWWYPQVTIKFIDVRGATVMLPAEKGYYDQKKITESSSIYKAFFSFPYPTFILKVKGFYGKGVTYRLALSQCNYDFDSSSGNFIINASFIGYMYGIYGDIPMTFLGSAPYMDGGREYWDSKVESGEFRFRDSNGGNGGPMLKIPDLKLKLAQAANNQEVINASARALETEGIQNGRKELIVALKDDFPFKKWETLDDMDYIINVFNDPVDSFSFLEKTKVYIETLSAYDYTYKTQFLNKIGKLHTWVTELGDSKKAIQIMDYFNAIQISPNDKGTFTFNYEIPVFLFGVSISPEDVKNDLISNSVARGNKIYNKINKDWFVKKINEKRLGDQKFMVFAVNKKDIINDKDFLAAIEAEHNAIDKQIAEETRYYKEKQEAIIEELIGFKPTIKNIYDLVFAHMDTFIHTFYDSTKRILTQLESADSEKRLKSHYHIKNGFTDTENESSTQERTKYLPPYAAYYDEHINGVTAGKTLTWPGDIFNGKDLEEVYFVENLMKASETFFKRSKDVENLISQMSESGETSVVSTSTDGSTPSTDVSEFIPITAFDFIFKDKFGNPYREVVKKLNDTKECIEAEILTILCVRALQYLHLINGETDKNKHQNAAVFGKIDAINLFKAVGDNLTPSYVEFLKKYGDVSSDDSKFYTIKDNIEKWLTGSGTDNPFTKYIQIDAPNLNKSLFKSTGSFLEFDYHKGELMSKESFEKYGGGTNLLIAMTPLFPTGIKQIQNIYTSGNDIFNNQKMAPSVQYLQLYNGPNSDVTTYALFEDKDYLTNIYNSFKGEIDRSVDYLLNGAQAYGDRDTTQYNDLDNQEEIYKEYVNNITADKLHTKERFLATTMISISKEDGYLGPNEINALIVGEAANAATKNAYNFKYVTFDYSFSERFPSSIFNNSLYWAQKDIKAKAYLFLCSLPVVGNDIGISNESRNGLELKSILLREGAYYWFHDNYDSFVWPDVVERYFRGGKLTDPSNYRGSVINGRFNYQKFSKDEVPLKNDPKIWNNDFDSIEYDTFAFFNIRQKGNSYPKLKHPKNCSSSRRKVLKKYFEDWATSNDPYKGFAANEPKLTDLRFYSRDGSTKGFEEILENKKPFWYYFHRYENNVSRYKEYNGYSVSMEKNIRGDSSRDYDNGFDTTFLLIDKSGTQDALDLVKLQDFLKDLLFGVCTEFDVYNTWTTNTLKNLSPEVFVYSTGKFYVSDMKLKAFSGGFNGVIDGFMRQLQTIYEKALKDRNENKNVFYETIAAATATNPFKNADMKLSTYMTLKNLYDKWLCAPYNGPEDTWVIKRENGGKSEFDNFKYVDNFYNDISNRLLVNVSNASAWLSQITPTSSVYTNEGVLSYTGRTLYEFIAQIAQNCGGMLLAMPQRFGATSDSDVREMFTPIPISENWDEDSSSYVFVYEYQPSQHLGDSTTSNVDMNGWTPEGDGLDLTNSTMVDEVLRNGSKNYTIPAFGVTYAKQNQSIFSNIQLTTASMSVTEASISATMNIAAKSSESIRESTLYGQDLYRVYSNYSYNCSVTMMGNAQIMPLMYFQLNNIPFWRGVYMIIKVEHNIVAGNMTTTIQGVRQNRYAIPIADGSVCIEPIDGNETDVGDSTSEVIDGYTPPYVGNNEDYSKMSSSDFRNVMSTDVGNIVDTSGTKGGPSRYYEHDKIQLLDCEGDLKKSLDFTPQFDESNVTPQKPIIYVYPAHSKDRKSIEHEWSKKVVDRIVEILRTYKFKDGTSYSLNVHRGRGKGSKYENSYTAQEAYKLVGKYGSKKVISLVPHWNGGGGNYWCALMNGTGQTTRLDSVRLMECICDEAKIVKANSEKLKELPKNMLKGACTVRCYIVGNKSGDSGTMPNCACALTENWFGDYSNDAGRSWLESNEGIENVAQLNARGIKRYIDTLS